MKVEIKKENNSRFVFKNGQKIATLRAFCCGIDFKPISNSDVIISILRVRFGSYDLLKCVKKLSDIDFTGLCLHWNFNVEIAYNAEKLSEYIESLQRLKNGRHIS